MQSQVSNIVYPLFSSTQSNPLFTAFVSIAVSGARLSSGSFRLSIAILTFILVNCVNCVLNFSNILSYKRKPRFAAVTY